MTRTETDGEKRAVSSSRLGSCQTAFPYRPICLCTLLLTPFETTHPTEESLSEFTVEGFAERRESSGPLCPVRDGRSFGPVVEEPGPDQVPGMGKLSFHIFNDH